MTSQPVPATSKISLCRTEDVADGGAIKIEHGDLVLAVYNVGGEFFVTDDLCTHGPGSLSEGELYGHVIECNFHGGQFDIRTGEVAGPPCMEPIKTYPVSIEDGHVVIAV